MNNYLGNFDLRKIDTGFPDNGIAGEQVHASLGQPYNPSHAKQDLGLELGHYAIIGLIVALGALGVRYALKIRKDEKNTISKDAMRSHIRRMEMDKTGDERSLK